MDIELEAYLNMLRSFNRKESTEEFHYILNSGVLLLEISYEEAALLWSVSTPTLNAWLSNKARPAIVYQDLIVRDLIQRTEELLVNA